MKASQTLPQGYREHGRISLKQKKVQIWLDLLAVPWFIVCTPFFVVVTSLLRPDIFEMIRLAWPLSAWSVAGIVAGILITLIVVTVLHELVHGLFFWLFTRSRPTFGLSGWGDAYAGVPGWYVPRAQYVVVGGAPLILLSLLAEALLLVVPWVLVPWMLLGLVANAVGAIGDLYVIVRLILTPEAAVIEDLGEEMTWYGPA